MDNKKIPDNKPDENVRIGVFICHCGSNIAGVVDCVAVTKYASGLKGVAFAINNLYTCSEVGIKEIQSAIKEHDLNRVVVASCSPRTHQVLFQDSCDESGLNPYLFEMVNIRDQCSWVHSKDPVRATEKAKDLVRMGVGKAYYLEPQKDIESSLTAKALVIGGGVAGLSAARALSDMGIRVILVEKEGALGGLIRKINTLAQGKENALERVDSLVASVADQPGIKVYLESNVEKVSGYIGNYHITLSSKDKDSFIEKVGCIVVATGAAPLIPENEYGYNGEDIITHIELESLLKKNSFKADSVVMIQCVGARIPEREYCSRICCMTAVKNAMIIKENDPETEVLILYRDMQMYGTENEKMLWDARGMGIRFDVYNPVEKPVVKNKTVRFFQQLMGEVKDVPFDYVILSTPLLAGEDAVKLSRIMKLPLDKNRFFMEAHAKLRPLDFATDGIFVCGTARFPATVTEAFSQGLGVAARVGTVLFKDKLVSSGIVAEINDCMCVGCMGCLNVCPFEAISYLPEKDICSVNPVLCKGCGSCAATCPSQSAQLKGFSHQQLFAQIKAIHI